MSETNIPIENITVESSIQSGKEHKPKKLGHQKTTAHTTKNDSASDSKSESAGEFQHSSSQSHQDHKEKKQFHSKANGDKQKEKHTGSKPSHHQKSNGEYKKKFHKPDNKIDLVQAIDINGNVVYIKKPEEFIEAIDATGKKVLIQKNSVSIPSTQSAPKKERSPEQSQQFAQEIESAIGILVDETIKQISDSDLDSIQKEFDLSGDINRYLSFSYPEDKIDGKWSRSQFFIKNPSFQNTIIKVFQERLPFVWVKFGQVKDKPCVIKLVKFAKW